MSGAGDAIGMMEGAFFVSKGIILEWLNELLDVSIALLDIKPFYSLAVATN